MAQGQLISISGHLNPCSPSNEGTPVTIHVDGFLSGSVSATTTLNANCYYFIELMVPDTAGIVFVEASCGNGFMAQDSTWYSATPPSTTNLTVDLLCGSASACTACIEVEQTAPFTVIFSSCSMIFGEPDLLWDLSGGGAVTGDNITHTYAGPGVYAVCLNLINDPACQGNICEQVYVDAQGNVSLDPPTNCQACFTIEQASGGGMLTPFVANFTNCTTGNAPFSFSWWMPNGTASTQQNTSYQFTTEGIYGVCLTIADANGCTSTLCDTVFVDVNGLISTTLPPAMDCLGILNGPNMPGTPCDDNDPETILDMWTMGCECLGMDSTLYDCLGILNGPNTFGTPCVDPLSGTAGVWDNSCICVADTTTIDCQAGFWVMQAYTTVDSLNNPGGGGTEPIPNELWIWNLSSGGDGNYQFFWSFGDGTSSTEAYPTHVYANGGPYTLCLTMTDGSGCTSTYCDEVSVDENGLYEGMVGEGNNVRSGFTIRVINQLPTSVAEQRPLDNLALWPNPVEDHITLSLNSTLNSGITLVIYDLNGRVLHTTSSAVAQGANRYNVNVTDLQPGMYVLQIGDGTHTTSRRFVKR